MNLPRRSWPSEMSSAKLARVCPFRSDQHLETNMPRPSVLARIRQLIRSKRVELRSMAEQQTDTRRKFSIAMCLQVSLLLLKAYHGRFTRLSVSERALSSI